MRFGKACDSRAIAPDICGAANDVPLHRHTEVFSHGARTCSPTAARKWAAPVPALSLKLDNALLLFTDPATITRFRAAASEATLVNGSGLSVPSLPAAMTTMMPCAVARPIASIRLCGMAVPPSDMLITLAPAVRAASTPLVIASLPNLQPVSSPVCPSVAQEPGRSARRITSVESNATPWVPAPLRCPAAVKATAVPWPLSSSVEVLPATSCEAAEIRLPKSVVPASIPLSMIPILTPAPVAPF